MAIQDYLRETLDSTYNSLDENSSLAEGGITGFGSKVQGEQARAGVNQDAAIGNLVMGSERKGVLDRLANTGDPALTAPTPDRTSATAPASTPRVSADALAELRRQGITDPQAQLDYLNQYSGGQKFSMSDLYSTGGGAATNYGAQLRDRIDQAFSNFKPKSEEDIIAEQMDMVQAQINAINAVYDRRRLDAMREGERRVGSTRSVNVAGGNAFDPMGATRIDDRITENNQIVEQLERERLAEISAAQAAARGEAAGRIERQADRLANIANNNVDALVQAFGLSIEEAKGLRDEAIRRAQITGELGGDPTLELRKFLSDEAQRLSTNSLNRDKLNLDMRRTEADIAYQEAQLAMAQQEAARAGYQLEQLDDGTLGYFDQDTRRFVVLGNYAAPRSGSGSGSGVTDTGGFIVDLATSVRDGLIDIFDVESSYGTDVSTAVQRIIGRLDSIPAGEYGLPTDYPEAETAPAPTNSSSFWDRLGGNADAALRTEMYGPLTPDLYPELYNR